MMITLYARSLMNKYGFYDGNYLVYHMKDIFFEGHIDFIPDRDVFLFHIVNKYLAPVLVDAGYDVEIEIVDSIHNPVRAVSINGNKVERYTEETMNELPAIKVEISIKDLIKEAKGFL